MSIEGTWVGYHRISQAMVLGNNPRSFNENVVENYNSFSSLLDHVKCFKCNNFGHKPRDCRRNKLRPPNQSRQEYIVRNRLIKEQRYGEGSNKKNKNMIEHYVLKTMSMEYR